MRSRRLRILRHEKYEFVYRTTEEYGLEERQDLEIVLETGGTCWLTDSYSTYYAEAEMPKSRGDVSGIELFYHIF